MVGPQTAVKVLYFFPYEEKSPSKKETKKEDKDRLQNKGVLGWFTFKVCSLVGHCF